MIRFIGVCLGAVCLMFLCTSCTEESQPVQLNTFKVTKPIVTDTVYQSDYVAEIMAIRNVELSTHIRGFLDKIHVDEGQIVRKGQILFSIGAESYKQELQRAKAAYKSALAELKLAEIEQENVKRLFDKNIIAKPELDLANAKIEAMRAKVEEAQTGEAQAALYLTYTEIRAPFDGMINRIPRKAGSYLQEGEVLTTISDVSEVFAYFHLSESDYLEYMNLEGYSDVKEIGQVGLTLVNNKPYPYPGIVEAVESEFDQSTGNIAIRAKFPNPEKILKHGSNGKITLKRHLKNAILIPQKSTFEIQDLLYVFMLNSDSTLEQKSIVSKFRIPHFFIVEKGIEPESVILFEGTQNVKNGDKIIPVLTNAKAVNDLF